MKYLCCFALLIAGGTHAGELLPLSGEEAPELQEQITLHLLPVVVKLPDGFKVEPVLESVRLSGRAKRVFLGPLALTSHITLRIIVTDAAGKTHEQTFHDEAGAWRGTFFRPGIDYDMIDRVVAKSTEFVQSYSTSNRASLETTEYHIGDDSPDGLAPAASMPTGPEHRP